MTHSDCYISGVRIAGFLELTVCWLAWWYPFIFRAPHRQNRQSVALPGPTRLGLLAEVAAFAVASLLALLALVTLVLKSYVEWRANLTRIPDEH